MYPFSRNAEYNFIYDLLFCFGFFSAFNIKMYQFHTGSIMLFLFWKNLILLERSLCFLWKWHENFSGFMRCFSKFCKIGAGPAAFRQFPYLYSFLFLILKKVITLYSVIQAHKPSHSILAVEPCSLCTFGIFFKVIIFKLLSIWDTGLSFVNCLCNAIHII